MLASALEHSPPAPCAPINSSDSPLRLRLHRSWPSRSLCRSAVLLAMLSGALGVSTAWGDESLRGLSILREEIHARNPRLARAEHLAAAARAIAPQVTVLPQPEVTATLFALPPETRLGAQRFSAGVRQTLPWFGKLALRERRALEQATAAEAEVARLQVELVTQAERLAYELAFLDLQEEILRGESSTLERYEEAAQARYSAGTGLLQESVRIQAEITRTQTRLIALDERRAALRAALNVLRDQPSETPLPSVELPEPRALVLDADGLLRRALDARPEIAAIDARLAAHRTGEELALRNRRPDLTLGLTYTAVESRDDAAAQLSPPRGNGDDIVALSGAIRLPIWKRALAAEVDQARSDRLAVETEREVFVSEVRAQITQLVARLPLLFDHWQLLDGVLETQAREALRSAETAYRTGRLNAVDLLDAEVVLFDVRLATARTRTDYALAWADLKREVALEVDSHLSNLADFSLDSAPVERSLPAAGNEEPIR